MIKRSFIKLFSLLTAVFIAASFLITASAAPYSRSDFCSGNYYISNNVYFKDDSGTFNDTQKQMLTSMFEKTADDIGFNIGVYCGGKHLSDSTTEKVTQAGVKRVFDVTAADVYNGTVFLYVDLDGKSSPYDYMCSYHEAYVYYTDSAYSDRMLKILHAMQKHFPKSGEAIVSTDIYNGLEEFCNQLRYYKSKGPESGAYYEDDLNGGYVYYKNGAFVKASMKPYNKWYIGLLVGLAVGAIIAACISIGVKKHYKFKSSTSASVYTAQNKIFMRESQDIFIGKTVTKTKIESRSGGGGGGFGGGGGGGGGSGSHR